MGKAVTKHLTYAWIEYGDPRDGAAFTDGLYSMGWKSALHGFPTKRDRLGIRYVDASHPMLPIRYRGSGLLISPNDRVDRHSHTPGENPVLDDPLYAEFRAANGDKAFADAIVAQDKFIADWVFRPGIKRVSPSESHLTVDGDATDHCDFVAISGHGSSGRVWGGGDGALLKKALYSQHEPATDRLKYVVIASCLNMNILAQEAWLPAMRRNAPVHGLLGYREAYPGDQMGEAVFRRFSAGLKAGSTILKAWRDAHVEPHSHIWAALMHTESAKNDTMPKWLAGKLDKPDKRGEIRSYNSDNYPDGEPYVPFPPKFKVRYMTGSTKIDRFNTDDPTVGLLPGDKGFLCIESGDGEPFKKGDVFKIIFYYYRLDKDGMNLSSLLAFGDTPDGTWELVRDGNRDDHTQFIDGIVFKFGKDGLMEARIPYTVLSSALDHYPVDGPGHGYFPLNVYAPERYWPEQYYFYLDGAWLKPRKA